MSRNTKRTNSRARKHARIEQWLREEVASVYDAMKANPQRGLPAKPVFAEARARIRLKGRS